MRLAVEAFSKAIMGEAGDAGGNLEFIAYTTGDSVAEVEAFYGVPRMAAEGWDDGENTGCGLSDFETGEGGAVCGYYKEGAARDSAVIIIAGPGDNDETSIF